MIDANSSKPMFVQVAEEIENLILKDVLAEGGRLPSLLEFAQYFSVNPLTVGKGMQILEDCGVVTKQRAVGMYVRPDAKARIYEYRKNQAFDGLLDELFCEADALGLSTVDIIRLLSERQRNRVHNAGYKSSN